MHKSTCSIAECPKPVRARGWCKDHYNTWYRTGDPLTPAAYQPNDICKSDGCNLKPRSGAADYCEMHYCRIRRSGTLDATGNYPGELHHGWVGDDVSYRAMHSRIRRVKGAASQHACVDCGGRAEQWSYDHQCMQEKFSNQGSVYSTDVDRYQPCCRSCHKLFDSARANQAKRLVA